MTSSLSLCPPFVKLIDSIFLIDFGYQSSITVPARESRARIEARTVCRKWQAGATRVSFERADSTMPEASRRVGGFAANPTISGGALYVRFGAHRMLGTRQHQA